ncbi:hypothetical protein [Leifsonia sp. C5G2]|uniref:hypothetical protein n=1 Tax=Leifsonia sp. C5G2 TaxID=2735269 RepID=UPI0015850AC1|nr:hypothetical protein [Leifsonia sp. C5G2]NUU04985.1 hypothetical protein [Leifsonia sp. C5G2]
MPRTANRTIPTVDDLAAEPVSHHYDDLIAPAGLTNHRGTVTVGHDLVGLSSVTFPPVSQGLAKTGALFVDGRVFESFGIPITHSWRPDRVVREAEVDGLAIASTTVAVPGEHAVAVDIVVRNTGDRPRSVRIGLALAARVTAVAGSWGDAESPNVRNTVEVDGDETRLVFTDDGRTAWSVQGLDRPGSARVSAVPPSPVDGFEVGIGGAGRGGEVDTVLEVAAGGTARVGYIHSVAPDREQAVAAYDRVAADVPAAVAAAERYWDDQLRAAFTTGNGEYSGRLPELDTNSDELRTLYWWGVLGMLYFRRDYETGVRPRTYDTLMPNYWATTTFIWDYSLSSVAHALLDPDEMRAQLLHWIGSDIHTHFGTSALTGGPVGRWYSVNDYAMTRLVADYVRITGDDGFLAERVGAAGAERTVLEHVVEWAQAYRGLRVGGRLADYGEIDNLLECVSSYTHEVASLNAANVWNLRTAADLLDRAGDRERAAGLRDEAEALLPHVRALYLDGTGHFAAGQPDGTRIPVRHCYDFNVVGTTIADDLEPRVRDEMVAFFRHDLQTDNWMRALSPWDPDASFSVRPDHQWNGAYPAWPADAARSLIALGAAEVALPWLGGLARTANQGPPGQAHFVEEALPGIAGGARKAPPQLPYINDWACSSAGAWIALVLESVFGVRSAVDGSVSAVSVAHRLDPDATLAGYAAGGRRYRIHADGRVDEE